MPTYNAMDIHHRVLVIEDSREIMENIIEILTLREFDVLYALDGKSGIEIAINNKPDIILCDILMPEMNGYDVLKSVKQYPELSSTPFILMSSQSDSRNLLRALDLGADAYIVKPFDVEDFLYQIESMLSMH